MKWIEPTHTRVRGSRTFTTPDSTSNQKKGPPSGAQGVKKGMSRCQSQLGKLREIDGFSAVGIFSPSGELVEALGMDSQNLAELGAVANEILLKSKKAGVKMGVGRSDLVHIQAAKAHVLIKCLDETVDSPDTTLGRTHIHVVLVIAPSGNLALAKIKLDSLIQEIAPFFR